MKKGSDSKRNRLRQGTFANLYQAMFIWLLVFPSRNVTVSDLVFKTKTIEFAEKISKHLMADLGHWKKQFNVSFT